MITLGGVPLVLPDLDGELVSWLDHYLPLSGLCEQAPSASLVNNRTQSRSGNVPGVGLTLPNYPPPPAPKLNTLYWPTGASRWARGYFLCHQEKLPEIITASGSTNATLALILDGEQTGVETTVETEMHLLPPMPLAAIWPGDTERVDGLYLLPLVDVRFYWQWRHTGALVIDNTSTTWADVYTSLGTQLGVTIDAETVSADYVRPDFQELTRRYENAAVLLDAVAHSCGQRIVRTTAGAVRAVDVAESNTLYDANLESGTFLVAGGSTDGKNKQATIPGSILVTFQKWRQCAVDPNGDLWTVTKTATSLEESESTANTVKVIHSSAFADFTTKGGTPDNDTAINTLATRIATDYYAWLEHQHDLSFGGVFAWSTTGFDDYVEWCFGRAEEQLLVAGDADSESSDALPYEYQAYTRVHSRPYNFGDEEQLQQFADMPVYPRLARFKLTETLLPNNSANAVFVNGTSGTNATNDTLTVYDTTGRGFGINTEIGWTEYKGDSTQWEFVCMEGCLTRPAIVTTSIPVGSSGTISIAGQTVAGTNHGGANAVNNDRATAYYSPINATWFFSTGGSGGGSGTNTKLYYGLLYVALDASDIDGQAFNLTSYTTGIADVAGPITFENPFNCSGASGDVALLAYHDGQTAYHIIRVEGEGRDETIEAWVYSPFNKDSGTFPAKVIRSYTGFTEVDSFITVQNQVDPTSNDHAYLFEGEFGAVCRVQWDRKSKLYRVVWVECPDRSPVDVESAKSFNVTDMYYGAGGQSPLVANSY